MSFNSSDKYTFNIRRYIKGIQKEEEQVLSFKLIFQDTYKIVLQWMFASGALLWQLGDILIRPSWTSKSFRFQNFIELFEKQSQKVE